MPRKARTMSSTGIYHIILRGVNHRVIFEEESDYKLFIDVLKFYQETCKYDVYAYCVMSNHVHLLMHFPNRNISETMKKIEDKFSWWYNKKYDRSGHLFQERFKSEPVEDEKYLATVFRYIHQNPIKAGIEERIGNYKWSSYFEYKSRNFFVVNPQTMIGLFGNYGEMMEFVSTANEDVCMEYMSDKKSDEDVVNIIKRKMGWNQVNEIYSLDFAEQKKIITFLKSQKISQRQICRVTGFSRNYLIKL